MSINAEWGQHLALNSIVPFMVTIVSVKVTENKICHEIKVV